MGPEEDLSSEEESEVIQIDTDAIPREIPWNNDDPKNETEVKGAAGGVTVFKKSSSNHDDKEDFLQSEDESSTDETIKRAQEGEVDFAVVEEDSNEKMSEKKSNDIMKCIKKAARENEKDDTTA